MTLGGIPNTYCYISQESKVYYFRAASKGTQFELSSIVNVAEGLTRSETLFAPYRLGTVLPRWINCGMSWGLGNRDFTIYLWINLRNANGIVIQWLCIEELIIFDGVLGPNESVIGTLDQCSPAIQ